MAKERTFWKPMGIHYTVNAAESGSGIARILVLGSVPTAATDEFVYTTEIKTTANLKKSLFTSNYNVNSGTVDITDGVDSLVAEDQISIIGMFYT